MLEEIPLLRQTHTASHDETQTEVGVRGSDFGPKGMPPQPLLKSLPCLFEAKQEPIRDAAKRLTVC